jgi:outer membrane protein assembly factor BamB
MKYRTLLILIITLRAIQTANCYAINSRSLPQVVWQSQIGLGSLIEGLMFKSMYKRGVLCHGQIGTKTVLWMKDQRTGKTLWQSADFFRDAETLLVERVFIKDSIMVIANANKHYGINLNTGKFIWRNRQYESLHAGITGEGTHYYFSDFHKNIFSGDVQTGREGKILSISSKAPQCIIRQPVIIRKKNENFLVALYSDYNPMTYIGQPFFSLYNLTKKRIVHTTPLLPPETGNSPYGIPIIDDNQVYFSVGNYVICCNLQDGKEIWKHKFQSGFLTSGIAVMENLLIANTDDSGIYALNPLTGKIVWQNENGGASSTLFYMDGVIYFTGGGNGLLYAINAKSGQLLWKIQAPSERQNENDFFFGNVTGADGKIYASSYTTLYCFKVTH